MDENLKVDHSPLGRDSTPKGTTESTGLRARAETHLRLEKRKAGSPTRQTAIDGRRLLHELQVHQIELEMQNAELVESRNELETLLEKFTDLYDFAPTGYFTLDHQGRILEVNLTGSVMLGTERSSLKKSPLSRFIETSCRPEFMSFLEKVRSSSGKQVCEAKLLKSNGNTFWASFHAGYETPTSVSSGQYRLAVSDISALKEAQDAQRHVEVLSATNHELKSEIVRRKAIELALRSSERIQTQMLEKSRLLQEQLRRLSHRIILTREEERRRISRELHDGITQTLVGINVNLETLARSASASPDVLRKKIVNTQHIVEKAVSIVHEFARELRPTSLDDLGLIVTLHSYLNDFMVRTGIRVRFMTSADVEKVDACQRTILYRIIQEALVNIDKHAQAQKVEVTIRKIDDLVHLEIADDGISFNVARALSKNTRLGLVGMRERAEMAGGVLVIESSPSQGTKITVTLPVKNNLKGEYQL